MVKVKWIADKNGFDADDFARFLKEKTQIETSGLLSTSINEEDEEKAVELFRTYLKAQEEEKTARRKAEQEREEAERKRQADLLAEQERKRQEELEREKRKKHALETMLITTGPGLNGYTVKDYGAYLSFEDSVLVEKGGLTGQKPMMYTNALHRIRNQLINKMKERAFGLGCNALICVHFDTTTIENTFAEVVNGREYVVGGHLLCVAASANAVVIEKN